MSSSGMRLHFDGPSDMAVGDVRPFFIASPAQRIKLTGRVVWVRRSKLFTKAHDVGVQFVDVPPKLAKAIEAFASQGFMEGATKSASDDSASPFGQGGGARAGKTGRRTDHQRPAASVDVGVPDLYAMLGVPTDAEPGVIRDAYHALAKTHHPDRNPDPNAAEEFANLSKAYKVLADPEARGRYDEMLRQHYATQSKPNADAA